MALLELRNVSKYFGQLAALFEINLEVEPGEMIGLVGPNGSGKTTLFNVVSGYYKPTMGEIYYDGKKISGLRPDQIATLRLIRIFQSNILYKESTVLENVILGSYLDIQTSSWEAFLNSKSHRLEEDRIGDWAEEILDNWELNDVQDVMADGLPHGYQRRLAIAVALAARPKLLLLDEPVAGMSSQEMDFVMGKIRQVADQGITVILVEHHVKTVVNFAERLIALDYGIKIADGKPQEVTAQKDVIEAYLGSEEVT
jgi:branched-chain amino acid transport system ATP-binding protein